MLFLWLFLACCMLILYICWYLSHHDIPHAGGEIRMEPSQQIIQQVNDIYKQIQHNNHANENENENGNGNGTNGSIHHSINHGAKRNGNNATTNGHINADTIKDTPNNNNNNNNSTAPYSATSPCSSIYGSRIPPSPVISSHRISPSSCDYDVIIMGGGAAGILQTLHLQLYCPGIKIAIIDPLPANRTGMAADGQWDQLDATHKIGESTVFFSGMFLVRDLNLGDYLIENHPPKYGLFYLWPKQVQQTANWSDYYSCVSLRMPELPSFQLDRVKLERDLLAHVLSDTITPVTYYQGTVKHVHLIDDEQQEKEHQIMGQPAHAVDILLNTHPTANAHSTGDGGGDGDGDEKSDSSISNRSSITLHGSHVIDCAGRAFVIGKQKKLITNKSSELMDIDNSSVWIHVTDYDMNLFIGDESRGQTAASWYYATNHFCGDGYWLWVIPIETRHGRALSIGVSFHKQVHTLNQFNTQDKFLRFLEANQNILYRIIMSGNIRLFKKLPRLAHVASQFYSSNNWYVMGEAAYNVDPWYSTGLTWCSFQIQHVSAIISSKLHITRAMYACQQMNKQNGMLSSPMSSLSSLHDDISTLTTHYNTFAGNLVRSFLLNINRHWKHLGNASIMSWRLLMETALSPQTVVGYMSKMYLCPHGCIKSTRTIDNRIWFLSGIYDLFDELIDNKINIGFQDYNEPGRIPFFESVHLDLLDADGSLRGGKLSFQTANMARIDAWVYLYLFWALMLLVWRGFGIRGYFKPIVYQRLGYLLYSMCVCYCRSWMWSFRNRHLITNQRFHKRKQEFTTYQGQTYVPW